MKNWIKEFPLWSAPFGRLAVRLPLYRLLAFSYIINQIMKTLFFSLMALAALSLAGCGSMMPQKKSENTATKSAESMANSQNLSVERITHGKPPEPRPNVTVSGNSNRVDVFEEPPAVAHAIPPHSIDRTFRVPPDSYYEDLRVNSGQSNNSRDTEDLSQDRKSSSPLWLSLIGGGIGLALIIGVIYAAIAYARKSSVAANAAFNTLDAALAARINTHKDMAMLATDPATIAAHTQAIAGLESQRSTMAQAAAKT
jgi:hypothetical protein